MNELSINFLNKKDGAFGVLTSLYKVKANNKEQIEELKELILKNKKNVYSVRVSEPKLLNNIYKSWLYITENC